MSSATPATSWNTRGGEKVNGAVLTLNDHCGELAHCLKALQDVRKLLWNVSLSSLSD